MRVVQRDDATLQSFLFSVPKTEEESEPEDPKPPPPPPPPRPISKKRRSRSAIRKARSMRKKPRPQPKPKPTPENPAIKEEVKEEEEEEGEEPAEAVLRWPRERYERTETKLIEILRERGGVRANPLPRLELREEARKFIGDTGLLDHLLKHATGKVVDGERFMRRHSPDGMMVYWLESADKEVEEEGRSECWEKCREEIGELKKVVGFLNR